MNVSPDIVVDYEFKQVTIEDITNLGQVVVTASSSTRGGECLAPVSEDEDCYRLVEDDDDEEDEEDDDDDDDDEDEDEEENDLDSMHTEVSLNNEG